MVARSGRSHPKIENPIVHCDIMTDGIIELSCKVSDIDTVSVRLLSDVWRQFAYLDLCMYDFNHRLSLLSIPLDPNYVVLIHFLRGDMPACTGTYRSYLQLLNLRHVLLAFGMRPLGTMATRANMVMLDLIGDYSGSSHAWDMMCMGWEYADVGKGESHKSSGSEASSLFSLMTIGVSRISKMREIITVALLPLCEDTIDVLNPDVLKYILHTDSPTSRESRVRKLVVSVMMT